MSDKRGEAFESSSSLRKSLRLKERQQITDHSTTLTLHPLTATSVCTPGPAEAQVLEFREREKPQNPFRFHFLTSKYVKCQRGAGARLIFFCCCFEPNSADESSSTRNCSSFCLWMLCSHDRRCDGLYFCLAIGS